MNCPPKQSNRIPKAPQPKRIPQLSGTFCKASYEERPKLSSRNSTISSKLSGVKHNFSHHETGRYKDNTSALERPGTYFALNQVKSNGIQKGGKNYRSMTSLMNKPAVGRKFSLQKARLAFVTNQNTSLPEKDKSISITRRYGANQY